MTDEVVTIEDVENVLVEAGAMWRFKFSNDLLAWIGMPAELVPAVGTELVLIYPNEDEVIVHLPVLGRVYPFKLQRGYFCA